MKKILLFATALVSSAVSAQVTLEHSYISNGGYNDSQKTYAFFTAAGLNYYTVNSDQNQVLIYNASHVLIKTVTLNLSPNYSFTKLMLATDGFFNSDAKIEFIIVSENFVVEPFGFKMSLFNEDGTNLQELGDRFYADYIKVNDNTFKLIASNDTSGENPYDIYSVPGVLSVQQQEMLTAGTQAYPNPTANRINISNPMLQGESGTVKIFSANGAKVLEQTINGEKTISLDVSALSNGTYIYKVNNHTGKFIKR